MDWVYIVLNIVVFLIILYLLYYMQKKHYSFSKRVFSGLGIGILLGILIQYIYGTDSNITKSTIDIYNIVGNGYVRFLQMIVMPLIFVSIVSSLLNIKDSKDLGKYGGSIIGTLIFTTAIAAIIGICSSLIFHLSADESLQGSAEITRGQYLESRLDDANISIGEKIVQIVPTNIFDAFAGNGSNATLSVVVFSMILGVAVLGIKRKKPDQAKTFIDIMKAIHAVVMRIVTLILRITPFGVMALMTRTIATSNLGEILNLGKFVVASYVALICILIFHMILLSIVGLNPIRYIKKAMPALTFGFTARSSAAAIPINIETQQNKFGVSETIASLSSSFGASIGQNACAGMYPAMLAIMIAPSVGINPLDHMFLIKLIIITTISSFGVAGVGGGATFAALIVLSSMNLPVALAGVLISIEPLIDMGRTAINVSGAMTSGLITAKFLKEIDMNVYNNDTLENTESID